MLTIVASTNAMNVPSVATASTAPGEDVRRMRASGMTRAGSASALPPPFSVMSVPMSFPSCESAATPTPPARARECRAGGHSRRST